MIDMLKDAVSVTVLDHHKTAEAELANLVADNLTVVFDMAKSGAMLTWEYFHPNDSPPDLVRYVQDRDLWQWALPQSKEVNAYIGACEFTFEEWDSLGTQYYDDLAMYGESILLYQKKVIDQAVANANEIELAGHKVLTVNTTVLFSEIAGKLAENRPFGTAWFIRKDGKMQWSLRSRDGGVDVSEIAKQFGGGGHRNAAGFEHDLASGVDWL